MLFDTVDPSDAARQLVKLLDPAGVTPGLTVGVGFDERLVAAARRALAGLSPAELSAACEAGAAWVMGARWASQQPSPWETVISAPARARLPEGTRRLTGETLIGMINEARRTLRIVAPFFDEEGVHFLSRALTSSAQREVVLNVAASRASKTVAALEALRDDYARAAATQLLTIQYPQQAASWPHLKVVVADADAAYVGSANMTGAALSGRNFELGVLLRGDRVRLIEAALESMVRADH